MSQFTSTYHSHSVSERILCPRQLEPNQADYGSEHHCLNQFEFAEHLGLGGFECSQCELFVLSQEACWPFFVTEWSSGGDIISFV